MIDIPCVCPGITDFSCAAPGDFTACSEDQAASFGIVGLCAVVCRWPWMGADAGACVHRS